MVLPARDLRARHLSAKADVVRAWMQGLGALVLDHLEPGAADGTGGVPAAAENVARISGIPDALHGFLSEGGLLEAFDDRPALFVATEPESVRPYVTALTAVGMACRLRGGFDDAINENLSVPTRWSCLVMDLDGFGGIRSTLDRLLVLRRAVPDLPVVLLSSEVLVSDFASERLPITDVTLRKPTTALNFELGMIEALQNNRLWQQRVAEYNRAAWEAALPQRRRPRLSLVRTQRLGAVSADG